MNLALPDPTLASQPAPLLSLGCAVGFLLTQGCLSSNSLFLCTPREGWIRQHSVDNVQHSALGSPRTFHCASPAQTTASRDSITEQASSRVRHEGFPWALDQLPSVLPPVFNVKGDEGSKDVPEKSGCRC